MHSAVTNATDAERQRYIDDLQNEQRRLDNARRG
jgi:hypothetical protein